jgi:uncharacterized protein
MTDTMTRCRFVWDELMTTDVSSAATFYGKVVGWKTQPSPQDPSYITFVAKGRATGGLMALPPDARAMGAPSSWLAYIGTPDVDETVRRATELGGRILKPAADIPAVGRFAVLQDPQGAVFAAFTPLPRPMRPDSKPALGDFSWHELSTTDWPAAFAFYQGLFGWEKTGSTDMGPGTGTYQMFGWEGKTLGGMYNQPKTVPGPPHWLPYAMVADSKEAVEAARRLGGRVVNGPMEVPGGDWTAQCLDLQGALFAVHSRKPAASEPPEAKKPARPAAAIKRAAKKPARRATAVKRAAKKPARSAAARKGAVKKPVKNARPAGKAARKNTRRPKARTKSRPTKGRR